MAAAHPLIPPLVHFIRKAIGWVLRDYSYTNPKWVEAFVGEHQGQLSDLSCREALKHLRFKGVGPG